MTTACDDLLTIAQAAEALGVTRARVYAYIHDGRLPAHRDGVLGALRLRAADVAAVTRQPQGGYRRRNLAKTLQTARETPPPY